MRVGPRCWQPGTALSMLLALLGGAAQAQTAQPLDFAQAVALAHGASGELRGARLEAQAKALQAESLERLAGPSLDLNGFAGRLSTGIHLDISQISGIVNGVTGSLPNLGIPPLPNALTAQRIVDLRSLSVGAAWPLYTGGRLEAVQGLAAGRAREAEAQRLDSEDRHAAVVAQRYFTVQLAQQAAQVRAAATAGFAEHERLALRFEANGLIARAERLRADVALDGARREEAKAVSDAALARLALQRLLAADTPLRPTTPLFVHSQGVGSLQSFIEAGQALNPAWQRLASKREQAEQALRLQGSEHTPTVLALGSYQLNRGGEQTIQPNWAIGLVFSMPLVGRIDKGKSLQAARLEQARVEAIAEQLGRDLPTLVESQWRALEQARLQFLSMGSALELAQENLRLQSAGFAQGQSTTLDVTDARLHLAQVQTERAQASYEYVMALARLLEASGQPQRLAELAASADVVLSADAY